MWRRFEYLIKKKSRLMGLQSAAVMRRNMAIEIKRQTTDRAYFADYSKVRKFGPRDPA
jgi:hypothetical protein